MGWEGLVVPIYNWHQFTLENQLRDAPLSWDLENGCNYTVRLNRVYGRDARCDGCGAWDTEMRHGRYRCAYCGNDRP